MELGLSLGLTRLGGGGWTPAALGASLLGWWDAERSDLITTSGGAVTSWLDVVAGYNFAQAISSQRPTYNTAGFNGRPVVTFDGVDDYLDMSSVPFPTGANPAEMWVLVDQTALGADGTSRIIFSYGGTANNSRLIRRVSVAGASNAAVVTGNGTTSLGASNAADFSGRHVARHIVDGVNQEVDVDGVAGTPGAVTPNIGTTRTRLAASTANVAASFHQGGMNTAIVTSLLSAANAALLTAYLKSRAGIP